MRINGEWVPDADGVLVPVLHAQLLDGASGWLDATFLVDTGAERTVLSGYLVLALAVPIRPTATTLSGLGGTVTQLDVLTRLRLAHDSGATTVVNGPFGGLPPGHNLEFSLLGRDVLGHFATVVDRPGDVVCLLSGAHRYVIYGS